MIAGSTSSESKNERPEKLLDIFSFQVECKKRLFDDENENDEILIKKQKILCNAKQKSCFLDETEFIFVLASRYQTEIPTQPFVVLTSHKNQRFYLLLKDLDESFQVQKRKKLEISRFFR